jgi:hypothetical protein
VGGEAKLLQEVPGLVIVIAFQAAV